MVCAPRSRVGASARWCQRAHERWRVVRAQNDSTRAGEVEGRVREKRNDDDAKKKRDDDDNGDWW